MIGGNWWVLTIFWLYPADGTWGDLAALEVIHGSSTPNAPGI